MLTPAVQTRRDQHKRRREVSLRRFGISVSLLAKGCGGARKAYALRYLLKMSLRQKHNHAPPGFFGYGGDSSLSSQTCPLSFDKSHSAPSREASPVQLQARSHPAGPRNPALPRPVSPHPVRPYPEDGPPDAHRADTGKEYSGGSGAWISFLGIRDRDWRRRTVVDVVFLGAG